MPRAPLGCNTGPGHRSALNRGYAEADAISAGMG